MRTATLRIAESTHYRRESPRPAAKNSWMPGGAPIDVLFAGRESIGRRQ
jgi:hypothetical protein